MASPSLTNRSTTLHNITLPTRRIDRDIDPGTTVEVDVAAPDAGRLAFACKFHGALGQRGEVIVARD